MPSKSDKDATQEAVPPGLIAQAEAAIYGNFEGETPPSGRRPSRAEQSSSSHYQNTTPTRPSTARQHSKSVPATVLEITQC
jgi:hypothetical protein